MFEKKDTSTKSPIDVLRPAKGTAKVIIGNGVRLKGEISDADEVQIDGFADVTVNTDNLVVGGTGELKGNINSNNIKIRKTADIDGTLSQKTLSIEEGAVLKIKTQTTKG